MIVAGTEKTIVALGFEATEILLVVVQFGSGTGLHPEKDFSLRSK
jgi:hypothetical protein